MQLGYNTNGLSNHDGWQAIEVLAEIGYTSIALTVDHQLLAPNRPAVHEQRQAIRQLLRDRGLRSVVESGARFVLDPRRKHFPTLMASDPRDRMRRVDYLKYCIELAADLGSDCVSLWSGARSAECDVPTAFDRLASELQTILAFAADCGVVLAFEPEPGMFIDTMQQFDRLVQRIGGDALKLTLDIGHLFCQGELPLAEYIERWQARLVNVHLEDMKAGEHRHLMFGEGEIEFPPVIAALRRVNYQGGVHVELSQHSHDGVRFAREAYHFLAPLFASLSPDSESASTERRSSPWRIP